MFKVVNVPICNTIQEYIEIATKTAKEQKEYFTDPLGNQHHCLIGENMLKKMTES